MPAGSVDRTCAGQDGRDREEGQAQEKGTRGFLGVVGRFATAIFFTCRECVNFYAVVLHNHSIESEMVKYPRVIT